MQWTLRLEARTDQGEAKITGLVTFSRPVVAGTLAGLGLALSKNPSSFHFCTIKVAAENRRKPAAQRDVLARRDRL